MESGGWARGHWSDRKYALNLMGWGIMVFALGFVVLLVHGPVFPLFFFAFGIALVAVSVVLYRFSPPEDQDDE